MLIRPADLTDVHNISELAERIWRAHYTTLIGAEQVEYMLQLLYSPTALQRQMEEEQKFWMLEDAGLSIGYLAISNRGAGRYFLNKFYVDNGQRGRGIGLIAFELLLAQYPDLQELRLTVNRQNFKSINFYFKIGFFIEQCIDIPIGEGFVMTDFQMLWRRKI